MICKKLDKYRLYVKYGNQWSSMYRYLIENDLELETILLINNLKCILKSESFTFLTCLRRS